MVKKKTIRRQTYLCSLMAGGMLLTATPLHALVAIEKTFVVDTLQDSNDLGADGECLDVSGQCSLRAAVQEANRWQSTLIVIPGGTYTLTMSGAVEDESASGDLDITTGYMTLNGSVDPLNPTVIEGGTGWDDRIFDISSPDDVSLNNLVVRGGDPDGPGGGIRHLGTGYLYVNESRITENRATAGGGVLSAGAMTFIYDTRIDHNSAEDGGGVMAGSNTMFINATIDHNRALHSGGGINLNGLVDTWATLENSTISGNEAILGGGVFIGSYSGLWSFNATITENRVSDGNRLTYGEQGGGLYLLGSVNLNNTIVAGNESENAPATSPDCYTLGEGGMVVSYGYNLIGISDGCTIGASSGDQIGTAAVPVQAHLARLGDYGGLTPTHALFDNSPAIDGGDPNGCASAKRLPLMSDQRGVVRPDDGDGDGAAVCDIGSFEGNVPRRYGGCTLGRGNQGDPLFPLMLLAAFAYLVWRRRSSAEI